MSKKKTLGTQLEKVSIADLRIDHAMYQRNLRHDHVRRIADGFDEDMFAPPTVAMRKDGSLWILDGQQRLAAAAVTGKYSHVLARVVATDETEREGQLFVSMNTSGMKVTPKEIFRAQYNWGDPCAVSLEDTLRKHGLTAFPNSGKSEIRALSAAQYAYAKPGMTDASYRWGRPVNMSTVELAYGAEKLEWALVAGSGMYQKNQKAADVYTSATLGSLIHMARHCIELPSPEDVARILETADPKFINKTATGGGNAGGRVYSLWADRLAEWINKESSPHLIRIPTKPSSYEDMMKVFSEKGPL